jgi:GNAT superfamily N-acetyltransferase
VRIRAATAGDIPVLQAIERRAGELFRDLGMDLVADDDPFSEAELQHYLDAGHSWVAVGADAGDASDDVVGYVVVDLVDGAAHVEQVSVEPTYARRGIGAALVEHVADWARAHGIAALTLTTYTEVPWNGPYYQRLGFRYLTRDEETPGLRALRATERAHGLDAWPRACMRRGL